MANAQTPDPDTKPIAAKEFDIQQYGTVVIDYKGRRERVTYHASATLIEFAAAEQDELARAALGGLGRARPAEAAGRDPLLSAIAGTRAQPTRRVRA